MKLITITIALLASTALAFSQTVVSYAGTAQKPVQEGNFSQLDNNYEVALTAAPFLAELSFGGVIMFPEEVDECQITSLSLTFSSIVGGLTKTATPGSVPATFNLPGDSSSPDLYKTNNAGVVDTTLITTPPSVPNGTKMFNVKKVLLTGYKLMLNSANRPRLAAVGDQYNVVWTIGLTYKDAGVTTSVTKQLIASVVVVDNLSVTTTGYTQPQLTSESVKSVIQDGAVVIQVPSGLTNLDPANYGFGWVIEKSSDLLNWSPVTAADGTLKTNPLRYDYVQDEVQEFFRVCYNPGTAP